CLLMMRAGVKQILQVSGVWTINTLVVAPPGVLESTRDALMSDPAMGYELVGSLDLAEAAALDDGELIDVLQQRGAEFVVVAIGTGNLAAERTMIGALRRAGCPIALVPALEGLPVVGLRQHHFFSHD